MASRFVDAGDPTMGDDVYYMLDGGPNAGLPRAAKVVRVYEHEARGGDGSRPFDLDLLVFTRSEDGVAVPLEVTKVPMTEVGGFRLGTWNYIGLGKPGFPQTPNPAPVDESVEVNQ